jgi:hypothetical protein
MKAPCESGVRLKAPPSAQISSDEIDDARVAA